MNNLEKAQKKVKCAKLDGPIYTCMPIPGPTGPAGPATIEVGETYTLNSNQKARVQNNGTNTNVVLDFYIPKGSDGNGDRILVGKTETLDANARARVEDTYDGKTHTIDFYIPQGFDGIKGEKGDVGPTGPQGPSLIEMAYLAKFIDNFTNDGIEVKELGNLPLTRKEIDNKNIVMLENDTIKFRKIGHFKVSFKVNAYVKKNDTNFDSNKDFVALGFKPKDSDNIYIGASAFIPDEVSREITADGILVVLDTNVEYNLVNLSNHSIYLKTPDLKNINSNSYFVNSPVTIIIEYLGN